MPAEMQIMKESKPIITEALIRETVEKQTQQWHDNFKRALGERPNLQADATLVLSDDGLSGNDIRIATNVYTCLLLNFEGEYIMAWECGPWECILYGADDYPSLHADNPNREYEIHGNDLYFTIETFKYLDRQFGTVSPAVPAYFNRNGPLFEVMAKEFERHIRWSLPRHPMDYEEPTPKVKALREELSRKAIVDLMLCWDRWAGME